MSGYGTYPTQYTGKTNEELYEMYRESVWGRLTEPEKRDLLQETVNRDAAEKGMIGAPRVEFAELAPLEE